MKTKLYLIILSLVFFNYENTNAQAPNWEWAKSISGYSDDYSRNIAVDANGNTCVAGVFRSRTITLDSITLNHFGYTGLNLAFFIAKYDASGNVLWAKSPKGIGNNYASDILTDANGNVYITGNFDSDTLLFDNITLTKAGGFDFYIAKYNPGGNVLWAKAFGGSFNDWSNSLDIDNNGNLYLTGYFSDSITLGSAILNSAGNGDVFLAKCDSMGNVLWAKGSGGKDYDLANGMTVDGNGNSYITGSFDSDTIIFGSYTLVNSSNGGYEGDVFIVKYDSAGNVIWAKSTGGNSIDLGCSIGTDNNGNFYLLGLFSSPGIMFDNLSLTNAGSNDIFLVKYNNAGAALWAKGITGSNWSAPSSLVVDINQNVYISGEFQDSILTVGNTSLVNNGGGDFFIAKYNSSGNEVWAKNGGSNYREDGWSNNIAVNALGNLYITGTYYSPSINFDNTTLTLNDSCVPGACGNIFIAKLNSTTGLQEHQDNELLSFYPNPFTAQLTITAKRNELLEVSLYDITSRKIFNQSFTTSTTINTEQLAKGIYLYEVRNKNGVIKKGKVVKD